MAQVLTKSQLNRVGERLRRNEERAEDLRALDDFRLSFESAYKTIFDQLTEWGLKPGGRAGKTILSIKAKLIRERTRLSRMQDIAGWRVVIDSTAKYSTNEQDGIVHRIVEAFPESEVIDRREMPRYGYRAVHVVAYISGVPVEKQVRTGLQHAWAEISEKLSDIDPAVKYGGGPPEIRTTLDRLADPVRHVENLEEGLRILRGIDTDGSFKNMLESDWESLRRMKLELHATCRGLIHNN
jgi:putative GTP pyrophosphokinase